MKVTQKRFNLIMGFRLMTLMFSFVLFSIYATSTIALSNAIIIIALLIVNIIVILLQREELDSAKSTILWAVEILGIFVILLLTGGIKSLYFWMILNPMLIGLNTNEKIHRIQHLILACLIGVLFVVSDASISLNIHHNIQMLFGTIVIIVYSYVTGVFLREQQKINHQLLLAQECVRQSAKTNQKLTQNIMESVELIEKMAIVEDYDTVIQIFSDYLSIILGADKCFLITQTSEGYVASDKLKYPADEITTYIQENQLTGFGTKEIYQIHSSEGAEILFSGIEYENYLHFYGYALTNDEVVSKAAIIQQLEFIRKLHKIIIAKLYMFHLKRELVIKDEQNRIAEEIHDNVNQQIFALTCQVYNLKNVLGQDVDFAEIHEIVDLMYATLQKTNKDLKHIIYRMSFEKDGKEGALDEILTYIDNISDLYGIEIDHLVDTSIIYCDTRTQNSILRIVNETIANAVKHGKAHFIRLVIEHTEDQIKVFVKDNGIGVKQYDLMKKEKGIGLHNLKRIADLHKGTFQIGSSDDVAGTVVEITLNEVAIQ